MTFRLKFTAKKPIDIAAMPKRLSRNAVVLLSDFLVTVIAAITAAKIGTIPTSDGISRKLIAIVDPLFKFGTNAEAIALMRPIQTIATISRLDSIA